jgi:hypothetical protein
MLRLLADENFNADILDGVLRVEPDTDVIRARDASLLHTPDPLVLEWAARHGRIVLTHDENTLVGHAYERVIAGLSMPGVILVHGWCPIGRAIDEVALLAACFEPDEIDGQVKFVPM